MYDATDDTKVSTFTQTSGNQFEGTLPSESGGMFGFEKCPYSEAEEGSSIAPEVKIWFVVSEIANPSWNLL